MVEQDQANEQKVYAVLDKVIQLLLPLDPHSRLRVYQTIGTFFGIEDSYPKVDKGIDSRVSTNTSREPQFSSSEELTSKEELTPKGFLRQKRPNTNIERVACLAYYLAHYRNVNQFKTVDISKLNTEAAQTKLSNASQTVQDAVTSGYLAAATTKGMKQLSSGGEQYVEALPDRGAAKEVKPRVSKQSRRKPHTNRTEDDREQESGQAK